MNSESSEEEPKLIIDEDWKTQVQREQEEARLKKVESENEEAKEEKENSEDSQSGDITSDREVNQESDSDSQSPKDIPAPPPATFSFLVSSLATQAMAALGQIPGEDGKPLPANLDYARHFIDLIGVMEGKTKGNLTDDEDKLIQEALHQLRMAFVATKQNQ